MENSIEILDKIVYKKIEPPDYGDSERFGDP